MTMQIQSINAPDLTTEYPRSPNEMLGGYVILPRTIDKTRADIIGKAGVYHWNCPMSKQILDFIGISAEAFREKLESGYTDEQMLQWIQTTGKSHSETDILAWSYDMRAWAPETPDMKAFVEQARLKVAPNNYNIRTFFQMLDAEEGRI